MAALATFNQVNIARRNFPTPYVYSAAEWNVKVEDSGRGDLAYLGNEHFLVTDDGAPTLGFVGSSLSLFHRNSLRKTFLESKKIIQLPPDTGLGYEQFRGVTFNGNHIVVLVYQLSGLGIETVRLRGYDMQGNQKWETQALNTDFGAGYITLNSLCFDGKSYYSVLTNAKACIVAQFDVVKSPVGVTTAHLAYSWTPSTFPTTKTSLCFDGRRLWMLYTTSARVGHSINIAQFQKTGTNNQWPVTPQLSGVVNAPRGIEYDGRNLSWLYVD